MDEHDIKCQDETEMLFHILTGKLKHVINLRKTLALMYNTILYNNIQ